MPSSQLSALCIGTVSFDTIVLIDRFPAPDERVEALDLITAVGGPAFIAAATLARLGVDVTFVGAVGTDEHAERIRDGVSAEGLDPATLITTSGAKSAGSVIMADRQRQTRSIAHRRGPPIDTSTSLIGDLYRRAKWVHTDHHGYASVAARTRELASPPLISLDAGYPIPELTTLAGLTLYAPPETRLRERFPAMTTEQALEAACAEGVDISVTTLGARGSAGYDQKTGHTRAPGYSVDVASTLGAGDVFHGALVAGLLQDMPLPMTLRWANAAAALSCRHVDAQSAIPTTSELNAYLHPHTSQSAETSFYRSA